VEPAPLSVTAPPPPLDEEEEDEEDPGEAGALELELEPELLLPPHAAIPRAKTPALASLARLRRFLTAVLPLLSFEARSVAAPAGKVVNES